MPGAKFWEKVNLAAPAPPRYKVQPGRPKANKRRLEAGEKQGKGKKAKGDQPTQAEHPKRPKKQNKCGKCGGLGHNRTTCKSTGPSEKPANKGKGGRPTSNTPWVAEQRRKKEERVHKAAVATAACAGSSSQPQSQVTQSQQSQPHQH
ncbi:hypothetical protein SOVF_163030 [Spinacia oleracea]|nr:hypothetical protein SOVF_163030 [Spinacia oleracea]